MQSLGLRSGQALVAALNFRVRKENTGILRRFVPQNDAELRWAADVWKEIWGFSTALGIDSRVLC
jgi:hypothetical protein